MTPAQPLAFVEQHGIVLEAARHRHIASLAEAIAGEALHGNGWSHPRRRAIFVTTRALRASLQILVCRLVEGKISFVHSRLWPALIRLSDRFAPHCVARLHETPTQRGRHRVDETPFPDWVPQVIAVAARRLTEAYALAAFDAPELAAPP